ncbi:MAG: endopeptidase La [Phycisphaeraceae bacterium]
MSDKEANDQKKPAPAESPEAPHKPESPDAPQKPDEAETPAPAEAPTAAPPAAAPTKAAGPAGDADDQGRVRIPDNLPVLPIRGTVVFPGTVMPLGVGRASSKKLLEESLSQSKVIALVTQRDDEVEDPTPEQLYRAGSAALVLKLIRQPDNTVSIIVHGLQRIRLNETTQRKPFLRANIERISESPGEGKSFAAAVNQLRDQARKLIELTPNTPEQAQTVLMNIEEPSNLADFLAANLNLDVQQKQDLLEETDVAKRVRAVHQHVSAQLEIANLQQKIQQDVQSTISESQRKFYLREQLKAIQKELGEGEDGVSHTVEELRKKLVEADPPEKVREEAERELGRLESIPPASPEYSMILGYMELLVELPWKKASKDNLDLVRARRILDRDHFDLDKVKRRLIEYLAVRKLNPAGRGPILCLVGPPGVGKTSLGQSVADALGRQFVRMSLGGIRDEAEVRGHRRTYIGAMPGRIIQEIRRAGTNNPVMMLDEVDKLGADFRGDPSSALLEVLDPRQNNAFVDRYLDVPFDLSQVLFIATANYIGNVPQPLQDRMEIIDIAGYTDNDKLQIARRYLVPRQLQENGLKKTQAKWKSPAIRKIIDDYTREAGVRELERQIGAVCRGVAAQVAAKKIKSRTISVDLVRQLLGPEKHARDLDTRITQPGVVVGLAYTPVGGEVLFIEATSYQGKGKVTLTGQIGDVMKESVSAAVSLFKSRAARFNFDLAKLAELDIHIHVPAGAVPKDGPSAGVAMFTAVASLLLGIPLKQRIAMTGEITLRGLVLPIGGVKEKTLAASRAGIKTVILPERNRRDLEEIDPKVRKALKFIFAENVDQLLEAALGKEKLAHAIKANGKKPRLPKAAPPVRDGEDAVETPAAIAARASR